MLYPASVEDGFLPALVNGYRPTAMSFYLLQLLFAEWCPLIQHLEPNTKALQQPAVNITTSPSLKVIQPFFHQLQSNFGYHFSYL